MLLGRLVSSQPQMTPKCCYDPAMSAMRRFDIANCNNSLARVLLAGCQLLVGTFSRLAKVNPRGTRVNCGEDKTELLAAAWCICCYSYARRLTSKSSCSETVLQLSVVHVRCLMLPGIRKPCCLLFRLADELVVLQGLQASPEFWVRMLQCYYFIT